MEKSRTLNATNTLTASAFALALSIINLMLFRGTISILAACFVPAIIVIFSKGQKMNYYLYVSVGLFLVAPMFFQTQIVFVAGYVVLALGMRLLLIDRDLNLRRGLVSSAGYVLLVAVILWMGMILTEYLFLIPLNSMMIRLSKGSNVLYMGILLLEGLLVFLVNMAVMTIYLTKVLAQE